MKYTFRVSPNYRQPLSTQQIMFELTLCILVVLGFSLTYYYTQLGFDYFLHALLMILTAVGVATGVEALWALAFKKNVVEYLSGSFPWVTGLLMVSMMGVNKPLYAIAVGAIAAILIAKLIFGGFGHNIFNPAGIGRVVVVLSFGGSIVKSFPDVITGATSQQVMEKLGWVITDPTAVKAYLDQFGGLLNFFLGWYTGALGETSFFLLALVGLYLGFRKIFDWKVPVVYIGTLFVLATVTMFVQGMGWWYPFFFIASGGAMFGAIFMLTDPVTSPTSVTGRVIFAMGAAFLTYIIRVKSNLPEGVIRSILFMNMMTPLIDQVTDGQVFRDFKKNLLSIGVIAALVLLTSGFISTLLKYNEPVKEPEEPVVVVTLGAPVTIAEVSSPQRATAGEPSVAGNLTTIRVTSDGYSVIEGGHGEPIANVIDVVINTETRTIESVSYAEFHDSKGIGDKTEDPIFLSQFAGLSIDDATISVDTVTGATFSSESVARAVNAAILALK